MNQITKCPVCSQNSFTELIACKDYTVSGETFQLVRCKTCQFTITNPQPAKEDLGSYYQSADYISHTDKANSIIDRLYLFLRKKSLRWKLSLLPTTPGNLLDYGCGTGQFLQTCSEAGWTISGVEPSPDARSKANLLTGINIRENLTEEAEKYSAITLWHVLEHVADLNEIIGQLKNSLKPEGKIFIAVPNHQSYDASYYQQYWAGYDVPRHLWHFSRETMNSLLKKNGLRIVDTIPMKLDSFYVSMLSEKYKDKSPQLFQLIKATCIGLLSNLKARKHKDYSSLIYVAQK